MHAVQPNQRLCILTLQIAVADKDTKLPGFDLTIHTKE